MSLSCSGSFPFFISPFWYKWLCKVTEKEVYALLSILQDLENSERLQQGTWCWYILEYTKHLPEAYPVLQQGMDFWWLLCSTQQLHREISQFSEEASACVGKSLNMSPCETRKRWQKKISQFNLKSAKKRSVSGQERAWALILIITTTAKRTSLKDLPFPFEFLLRLWTPASFHPVPHLLATWASL